MVEGEPHRLCQVFLAWESIKIKLVSLNDSIPGQPRSTSNLPSFFIDIALGLPRIWSLQAADLE
jgi:hypothetical protein